MGRLGSVAVMVRAVWRRGRQRAVVAAAVFACLFLSSVAAAPPTVNDGVAEAGIAADLAARTERAARAYERAAAAAAAVTAGPAQAQAEVPPTPVAGLSQAQMNNAQKIVKVGQELGVPERGLVIAIATALQESNLKNLANTRVPESAKYPNEGSGSDHDSVGLFQQRPSTGWGTVKNLMNPEYAARQFFKALLKVPGWQNMALTRAAQAVQRSAFPDAYAKHEKRAQQIVDALLAG